MIENYKHLFRATFNVRQVESLDERMFVTLTSHLKLLSNTNNTYAKAINDRDKNLIAKCHDFKNYNYSF
jgi:hypothetical protein